MYVQQFEYPNVGEMQLPCASGPWSLFHHPYNAAPHASLRSCRCVVRRMAYAIWPPRTECALELMYGTTHDPEYTPSSRSFLRTLRVIPRMACGDARTS